MPALVPHLFAQSEKGQYRMSSRVLRRSASIAAALALVAGPVLLSSPAAYAATTPDPAITGDPNASNGTVAFFDTAGTRVYSGTNLSHLFDYALASTNATRSGSNKATLFFGFPDHTKADSTTWFESQQSASTTYPNATAPAPLSSATQPLVKLTAGDGNLQGLLSTTAQDSTSGYAGILQVRVYDSGPGVPKTAPFWASDIYYDATAGTWQQMYPAPPTATTTTVTATPATSTVGQTVTIKATIAPSATPGSVQFYDGASAIGSPVTVSGGIAQTTTNTLTTGSHTLKGIFTPTDPSTFQTSQGTATETVTANPTTTTLAISGNTGTDGNDVKYTATVSPSAAPGSVLFYDNGSTTAVPGTVTNPSAGTYQLDLPAGAGVGTHSVVAKFTPTDPSTYGASQSAASPFTTNAAGSPCTQPGSVCSEDQNVQADVPIGTLVINTPYTSTQPLNLGSLALDPTGTFFTGSAPFQNIKVTDTRSGALPWTAAALSTALSDGSSNAFSTNNAQNVGLTGLTAVGSSGYTGTTTVFANAAAAGVAPTASGSAGLGGPTAHTIATASHGPGVVTMNGTLTINAPAATEAGTFKGVITFTVG